ncbi:MAG: PfkB family carbohydrate kinase [Gemmatimonadales bacterium]|nr:PfkB family carbohydrate kinase [Gemmatimonadales bacterium]
MPRLGVIGSLVWDEIHGRDPARGPVQEWGGIGYALAALDAALAPGWELVPLVRVGRDLAPEADAFLRTLDRRAPGARFIEVPAPNNRVVLHYETAGRRCERMSGGVPAWTWPELGPLVADLDALYVNFISGFEMCFGTAERLRQGFAGPIYADLHSLFLGMRHDGVRELRPLPNADGWFGCFDAVQVNEDELRQLGDDARTVAAGALAAGAGLVVVTLGPRGAQVADGRPAGRADWGAPRSWAASRAAAVRPGAGPPVRLLEAAPPAVDAIDPTGCGDVFGATLCARLLAGDALEAALARANAAAARNATLRGASGLAELLRGRLLAAG